MSEEKTENQPTRNPNELPSPSNKITLQAFERSLTEAHQRGRLFFLAVQLASMLQEHYEKYGMITASELESLIAKAAEEMVLGSFCVIRSSKLHCLIKNLTFEKVVASE